jgi:hypothetical protein
MLLEKITRPGYTMMITQDIKDPDSLASKWYWEVDFIIVKQLTRNIMVDVIDEMVTQGHISPISKQYERAD